MKKTNINYWLKNIISHDKNGNEITNPVFDFDKMWNDDCNVWILVSPRGKYGKSYGASVLAKEKFEMNGLASVWVKNLAIQIKLDKRKWLTKPKEGIHWELFHQSVQKGEYIIERIPIGSKEKTDREGNVTEEIKYEEIPYIYFHSLNAADTSKGARANANALILDEANEGLMHLNGDQNELLRSLEETYSNPTDYWDQPFKKEFIMCNFKSMNLKLLYDMGITTIDDEVTEIKDSTGKIFIRILVPIYGEAEKKIIENHLKGFWIYEKGKITGTNAHSTFNKPFDIINNIVQLDLEVTPFEREAILFSENIFFHFLRLSNNKFHIIISENYVGNEEIIYLQKKDLREGFKEINAKYKRNIVFMIQTGLITFQDQRSRDNFIKYIIK